jgi:excisionase family DNA binding protein
VSIEAQVADLAAKVDALSRSLRVVVQQPAPQLFRTADAARLLAISEQSVRRLIAAGHLPAVKHAGLDAWRISARSIEAYVGRVDAGEFNDRKASA